MNAFVEFFNRPFPNADSIPFWGFCLLVALVAGLSEGLKQPIKIFTRKIAYAIIEKREYSDDNARETARTRLFHRINMVIIALPVLLGVLAFFVVSKCGYSMTEKTMWYGGSYCGYAAIALYEVACRITTLVKKRKAENGKVTAADVAGAIADGLIGAAETSFQTSQAVEELKSDDIPEIDEEQNEKVDAIFDEIVKGFDDEN